MGDLFIGLLCVCFTLSVILCSFFLIFQVIVKYLRQKPLGLQTLLDLLYIDTACNIFVVAVLVGLISCSAPFLQTGYSPNEARIITLITHMPNLALKLNIVYCALTRSVYIFCPRIRDWLDQTSDNMVQGALRIFNLSSCLAQGLAFDLYYGFNSESTYKRLLREVDNIIDGHVTDQISRLQSAACFLIVTTTQGIILVSKYREAMRYGRFAFPQSSLGLKTLLDEKLTALKLFALGFICTLFMVALTMINTIKWSMGVNAFIAGLVYATFMGIFVPILLIGFHKKMRDLTDAKIHGFYLGLKQARWSSLHVWAKKHSSLVEPQGP